MFKKKKGIFPLDPMTTEACRNTTALEEQRHNSKSTVYLLTIPLVNMQSNIEGCNLLLDGAALYNRIPH